MVRYQAIVIALVLLAATSREQACKRLERLADKCRLDGCDVVAIEKARKECYPDGTNP